MFYSVLYQQYDNRCSIFFLFLGRHKGYTHLKKFAQVFTIYPKVCFSFFLFLIAYFEFDLRREILYCMFII